jgi:acylphosphatase
MKQAHLIISGYVQGVWYRKFVKTNAVKLGITGWVRNITNGKVEAIIQGEEKPIEQLIKMCRVGPQFAEVKNVDVEWEVVEEKFEEFVIR